MRYLQNTDVAKAIQWPARGFDPIQSEKFLFDFVWAYESGARYVGAIEASTQTPEEFLREMRITVSTCCSPLRPGPAEQYFREHPNALQQLSQLVASRSKAPWSHPIWAVPMLAGDGLSNKVDRHRGLGNAVVPVQAREAFERLIGL